MVDSLKQDYASKQAALVSSAAEFEKKMGKQEAAAERLIKLETKRADAAEREAAGARRQVEEERLTNGELRKRIGVIEGERRYVEEEGRRMVVDAEGAKDGLLVSMKEKMAELERINKDLVVQCRTLRERYEKNDLVRTVILHDGVLIHSIYVDGRREGLRRLVTEGVSVTS